MEEKINCDKCGTEMKYDRPITKEEIKKMKQIPNAEEVTGDVYKCPKCARYSLRDLTVKIARK